MSRRLTKEEIVTISVLNDHEESNRSIARRLGVSEGAVRYHVKKKREGRSDEDRRRDKPMKAAAYAQSISRWLEPYAAESATKESRAPNLRALHQWLEVERGYEGSYKSVVRYVQAHHRDCLGKRRPYRRVELPPGAQAQVDWCQRRVIIGGVERELYGFWMLLSHSRAEALIWSASMDQMHWQRCHNEAFRRLGGVTATVRVDNLRTAMTTAGPNGRINASYQRFADACGFHVDACLVRHPEGKGKVESRIGRLASRLIAGMPGGFADIAALQTYTDEAVERESHRRRCPATGASVAEAWQRERERLRGAEALPEPFDVVVSRPVHKDCTVCFEGRSYSVPFNLAWRKVEVRGSAGEVSFWHEGREVARHPRGTDERVVLDEAHYSGPSTPTHQTPLPLGKVGRKIRELAEADVQLRSVDYYAQLAEVCS